MFSKISLRQEITNIFPINLYRLNEIKECTLDLTFYKHTLIIIKVTEILNLNIFFSTHEYFQANYVYVAIIIEMDSTREF